MRRIEPFSRTARIGSILLFLAVPLAAADTGGEAIFGRWRTDDGKAIVAIGRCGDLACGTIAEVLDRSPGVPRTDVANPSPALRKRPILGMPVLAGFRRSGSQWTGGRAYDPKTGSSYRARLSVNPDGSLKVTGCVLFVCRSKRWLRAP
jgi:uncharacterized protein (DUF2147 family)